MVRYIMHMGSTGLGRILFMSPRDLWAQAQQHAVIVPCPLHGIRAVQERTHAPLQHLLCGLGVCSLLERERYRIIRQQAQIAVWARHTLV